MKPEKLILCGWGPYKDKTEIDFTKLNNSGIFLVTGQTGAGKTTVFDAIAYALYGVLSGEVREKGSVRSDFAGTDTKTYVELYMNHKNECYHIIRNPEYMRPKKRKSGENAFTKEKENAVMTMPDGSIIAGNQEVTTKIEELLAMDGRQFRQISMIAQGEFSKMLFAPSAEKNAIFRELFGTGIYAQIQALLKSRSGQLYQEYMVYKNKMEEDVRLLDIQDEEWKALTMEGGMEPKAVTDYLKKILKRDVAELSKQKEVIEALEGDLLSLHKEMESIHQINERFHELDENKKKIEELVIQQPEIDELEKCIQTVKKAQVLAMEEKVLLEKEQALQEVLRRSEFLKKEITQLYKQSEELQKVLAIKDELFEALETLEQIRVCEDLLGQQIQEQKEITVHLEQARENYETVQQEAENDNRCYEEADARYKRAVIGIAAKLVKEGEPCPVCGSIEHPRIAHSREEIPDEKQLDALKKKAQESRIKESRLYEQTLLLINEEKILQENLQKTQRQKEEATGRMASFRADVLMYVKQHTRKQLEEAVQKSVEIRTICQEKQHNLEKQNEQEIQKKTEVEQARLIFTQKLKENGFEGEKAFKQAVNIQYKLPEWEQQKRNYEDSCMASKKMQEYLQELLKGCEYKDEAPYMIQIQDKQDKVKEYRSAVEQLNISLNQITRCIDGIEKNYKKAEKIKKEYGIVKDLDDMANGNNARRLVLEQYVLAGYFEEILKAANLRLKNMTDGRYELLRAGQVSDGRKKDNLEIEVMDYYTGRRRSVKTLSGGETFKAALAMALGMSDCIQAESGGMEIETLFIDEGFGALDEESLELACETLQSLAGKNRMVGVISHVAQLRERIEHQIIIEKRNNGSCAKVI